MVAEEIDCGAREEMNQIAAEVAAKGPLPQEHSWRLPEATDARQGALLQRNTHRRILAEAAPDSVTNKTPGSSV